MRLFQCFIERFAISCSECVTQRYRWRLRHLLWRSAWKETCPSLEQSLAGGSTSLTAGTTLSEIGAATLKQSLIPCMQTPTGRGFPSMPGTSSHISILPVTSAETVWRAWAQLQPANPTEELTPPNSAHSMWVKNERSHNKMKIHWKKERDLSEDCPVRI